ncbi:MAG: ABC transporter ATP-binding protein, partial [Nisaea sp.]
LDKKLRADLQWELKALHDQLGVTFIYVTHDQDEALSMSDRIVILKDGKIQQAGVPDMLYNKPRTRFVADFLGKSNFLTVKIKSRQGDHLECTAGDEAFPLDATGHSGTIKDSAEIALRPERIRLAEPGKEFLTGTVKQVSYLGERCQVLLTHSVLGQILVSCPTWKSGIDPNPGLHLSFGWDTDACVILEAE